MSDDKMESLSHEEEEDEEDFDDEDVQDDQELIYQHNEYLAEYLPGFIYAVKTCAKEALVKSLDLAHLGLEASHLRQFFKFLPDTQIIELNLEDNDLRWVVQEFAQQLVKSKLSKLSLQNCTIQDSEVLLLMQALKSTQITDLDLSGLSDIHLSSKSATTFLSFLLKSRVTRLNLSGSSLMNYGGLGTLFAQHLPRTSITELDLSHCMKGNTEVLKMLFTTLPRTSVTELNLTGNEISDDDLEPLCQNLGQTKLEVLILHFNKITDTGINMLAQNLVSSKVRNLGVCMNEIKGANNLGRHLKETIISILNIGTNLFESYEMFSFPNFVEGTSVTELGLDYSGLGDEEAQNLMKCLRSSKVTKLHVNGNKFGLLAVTEFAKILKDSNITEVNFSRNNLSEEAFQKLGDGLKGSKLQKLNVSGGFSEMQAGSMITALIDKTKGTALDSLNISNTNFENDSSKLLASSLTNTTFTHLDLRSCKIGAGIAHLALVLKYTAITHLNLSEDEIDNEGAEKLAESLKETQIVKLKIERNTISDQGAKALVACLKTTSLHHLNLYGNKITNDGIEEIAEMLEGTFVSDLNVDYNKGHETLPVLTVLWRNRFLVHKLVSFFKMIAPITVDGPLDFDRNVDGVFAKFVERCLLFYKAVIEQPSAISALAEEESLSFTRKQVAQLVLEEFPRQLASFVGSKTDVEVAQHVRFLEKAEECKLNKIVEHLLANQPILMINKNLGILHPVVYRLLNKYKLPFCSLETEAEVKSKVIKYFTEHPDVAGASDVIKILSN